jgi:hypothetical protein
MIMFQDKISVDANVQNEEINQRIAEGRKRAAERNTPAIEVETSITRPNRDTP